MLEEQKTEGPVELKPPESTVVAPVLEETAIAPDAATPAPAAADPPAAEKPEPTGKTKIVITYEKDAAIIGITRDKCDPRFFKAAGDLPSVVAAVPAFLEEAIKSWKVSKKNPQAAIVTPPPAVISAGKPATKATSTKPATPAQPAITQQKFF